MPSGERTLVFQDLSADLLTRVTLADCDSLGFDILGWPLSFYNNLSDTHEVV